MSDTPERVWRVNGRHGQIAWPFDLNCKKLCTEYRRADAPPTVAEAMRCPEVQALVEAVIHEREMVCQDMGMQLAASVAVADALAPFTSE